RRVPHHERTGRVQRVRSLLVATARARPEGENPAARPRPGSRHDGGGETALAQLLLVLRDEVVSPVRSAARVSRAGAHVDSSSWRDRPPARRRAESTVTPIVRQPVIPSVPRRPLSTVEPGPRRRAAGERDADRGDRSGGRAGWAGRGVARGTGGRGRRGD